MGAKLVPLVAVLTVGTGLCASAQASPSEPLSQLQRSLAPSGFGWFEARPAPSGWKRLAFPSSGAFLSYPSSLESVRHDNASIAVGGRDRSGRIWVYLNVTPKQGDETLADWPAFRLQHDRGETNAVHEDARAYGLTFIGGMGSCVADHYLTRVVVHAYREIACFVQGRTKACVIVAAALVSDWPRAATLLERAVEAYQVT